MVTYMMGNGTHMSDMASAHTHMPTLGLVMLECGRTDSETARANSFMPITSLSESSSTTRSHLLVYLLTAFTDDGL